MTKIETAPAFDTERSEQFGDRLVDVLNSGALALMTSIGHRTGLFDAMAGLPASTSAGIAEAAGLDERYVREWLGAMLTGGVVTCTPADGTYALPAEHAAFLTRDAAPNNLAAFAQYMSVLGSVEDAVVECFRHGGGVPYSAFPRFQEVMAEDSGQSVLPALFEHILPLVPDLLEELEAGIEVMDVGCGSGRALCLMAERFPASRFRGVDVSPDGLAAARALAASRGLTNVRFDDLDAAAIDDVERYDLVTTFDAVHDQVAPRAVLANIRRALKPTGTYLMQDIGASSHHHENVDHPLGPLLYAISCLHCMTVSLAGGGEGLGAMWGEQVARELLAEAGFRSVVVHRLSHDPQNYYYVVRKD